MKAIKNEGASQTTGAGMSLMRLTIPILIETALVMMLGFVDVFVLGRYNDLAASGVNTANQAVIVISTIILVFFQRGRHTHLPVPRGGTA